MKRIIYTVLVFVFPFFAYAQDSDGFYLPDVEGVEVGTKMTYNQVVAKFGQPDEVKIWDEDFPEGSSAREYQYDGNSFVFSDYGGLIEFGVRDDRFALLTNYIDGGLRVGDPLSKIQDVNIGGPLKRHSEEEDGTVIYHLFSEVDDHLWIHVKNGAIIYMDFTILM